MLSSSRLNDSLFSEESESLSFLNEVMSRFPDALSFAPGACSPHFLENINIEKYLTTFKNFLTKEKKLNVKEINDALYQYGPSAGIINDLLIKVLKNDRDVDVSSQSIVVTSGAQEAIILVLKALFGDSTSYLMTTDPFYTGVQSAAVFLDIPITYIEESNSTLNLPLLENTCKTHHEQGKPIKAFILGTDFSNPGGSRLNLIERQELLHLASKYDFFIIEDNTYAFTYIGSDSLPSLKKLDREKKVISIETMAKSCFPGVRIGYIIADQIVITPTGSTEFLAEGISRLKSMNTLNTSPICQGIIGGIIIDGKYSLCEQEKEKGRFYAKQLQYLISCLNDQFPQKKANKLGISWNNPEGGFFIRVTLPIKADINLLEMCAKNFNVLWTPMSFFSKSEKYSYEIRLSCSYLGENEISEGVSRLVEFFLSIAKTSCNHNKLMG